MRQIALIVAELALLESYHSEPETIAGGVPGQQKPDSTAATGMVTAAINSRAVLSSLGACVCSPCLYRQ